MSDIMKIAEFLKSKIKHLKAWDNEESHKNFLIWLAWLSRGGNIIATGEKDKITGVMICRPINSQNNVKNKYYINDHGRYLLIDMVASERLFDFKNLIVHARNKFPKQKFLIFSRDKHSHLYKTYLLEDFIFKIFGLKERWKYA